MTRKEFFEKMRTIKTAEELYEFIYTKNNDKNLISDFECALNNLDLRLDYYDDFLIEAIGYLTKRKDFESIKELLKNYGGNKMVLIDCVLGCDKMVHYNVIDYIDDIVEAMQE